MSSLLWEGLGLRGPLQWAFLPSSTLYVDLAMVVVEGEYRFNYITGSVETGRLPPGLRSLVIGDNLFVGTPDLAALPVTLRWLDLSANRLSGEVNLGSLPPYLQQLHLNFNKELSGELWEDLLPKTLTSVSIEGTRIVKQCVVVKTLED